MDGKVFKELPDAVAPGETTLVQIAPRGMWPVNVRQPDGSIKRVVQMVDDRAIQSLVESFDGEVLVDCDHSSDKGRSTEAYAWITELRDDPDEGLVGLFRWTDLGAEAVSNRRYRYVSASWSFEPTTVRPIKLLAVALTNKPNLPTDPILNSIDATTEEQPTNPEKGDKNMDKLRELLGLPPEATEDEIMAAVVAKIKELDDLKAQAAQNEAEEFAQENKDKVEDPTVLKNAYLRDPDLARNIICNIRVDSPRQRILNSRDAITPSLPRPALGREAARQEMSALPPSKRDAYYQDHKALLD